MNNLIKENLDCVRDSDLLDFFFYEPFGNETVNFELRSDKKIDEGIYYNLGLMRDNL